MLIPINNHQLFSLFSAGKFKSRERSYDEVNRITKRDRGQHIHPTQAATPSYAR